MFSLASSTFFAIALSSTVGASSNSFVRIGRHHNIARVTPPKGWATQYLEPYNAYHERYEALKCPKFHGDHFFDVCCHPLLSTESLTVNRPACCVPGSTASCPSKPGPAEGDDAEEDCEDEEEEADDEEDSDDCEDDEDDEETGSRTVARSTSPSDDDTASTVHTNPKPITTVVATHGASNMTAIAETSTKTVASPSGAFITGGFGTWFTQNGVKGACGKLHQDSDFVVALPTKAYAKGANCFRKVRIYDTLNGKTADAIVGDECPTCRNSQCLDMSVALFKQFATLNLGEFAIKYEYI